MIDLRGRWKHLSIPAERFQEEILEHGIGFDGSNYGYAMVENSDMVFIPDISTAVVDPFVKVPTLTMIGDVKVIDQPMNRPFAQYSRNVAKRAVEYMKETEIADEMIIGPEYGQQICRQKKIMVFIHRRMEDIMQISHPMLRLIFGMKCVWKWKNGVSM